MQFPQAYCGRDNRRHFGPRYKPKQGGNTLKNLPESKDLDPSLQNRPLAVKPERRAQARVESVLSRIEDATYAVLRKHEKSA
jgi:hypothetical protein